MKDQDFIAQYNAIMSKETIGNLAKEQEVGTLKLKHYNQWLAKRNESTTFEMYPGFPVIHNVVATVKCVEMPKKQAVKKTKSPKGSLAQYDDLFIQVNGDKAAFMAEAQKRGVAKITSQTYFYNVKRKLGK